MVFFSTEEYEHFSHNPSDDNDPLYKQLASKSFDSLLKGVKAFEEINDNINLAFLRCNMGRFYRLRGHLPMPKEEPEDLKRMKLFYQEAFKCYEQAKLDLESRKVSPDLWDLVDWELSTATFNLAKQMQDYTPKEYSYVSVFIWVTIVSKQTGILLNELTLFIYFFLLDNRGSGKRGIRPSAESFENV